MKLQTEKQKAPITDAARARIALMLPVLKGVLLALQQDRVERLGGHEKITLADLAREYREGSADCGICFEYAVHHALRTQDPLIYDLISEVLEEFCGIRGGAQSILFGTEKTGAVSLIETPDDLVSRILSGTISQPAKLKKNSNRTKKALRDAKTRDRLPISIKGIWKADLFVGSANESRWLGTTLKLNKHDFEGAPCLRVGIFPETKPHERPARDEESNLILCPLPYNMSFMELFYSGFFTVKQFLLAGAKLPKPVALPNAGDRFVAQELEQRRSFAVLEVLEGMYPMGQPNLTDENVVGKTEPSVPLDALAPVPAKTDMMDGRTVPAVQPPNTLHKVQELSEH